MQSVTPHTIGIIADDLTSAADGAAPFIRQGWCAQIGRGRLPALAARENGRILAVDTGSRSLPVSQAAARVGAITTRLADCDILYKTVDSTLRGHVKAELAAAFHAGRRRMLVFAPAFPAAGRITVDGIQQVDGIPVADSLYGHDPVHPARYSALADLVPDTIRQVAMLDASTQEALDTRIAAFPEPESILWAGSPGMAIALARRLTPVPYPATPPPGAEGDILIVIGTANPRSHTQAGQLNATNGVILLRAPDARQDNPAPILRQLARRAAQTVHNNHIGALIATGGDTMEAILDQLAIHNFEVLHELEPGFPLGRALLEDGRSLLIAMKAGGFGDENTLKRAVALLHSPTSYAEQMIQ